ncbi:aldehyde dehydrogenase [Anditalea andensis]|uniref:Aldehyde dehydrogenase n=1 Tax=Anditalea andensis TaxID=1048983 RepID=A0A074LNS7_9BACT|nr:aldehyde dehydrogenase [Anditalea andensis]
MRKSHEPIEITAYINGEVRKTAKKNKKENPAHPEETVGYFPENTVEDVKEAIDYAYEAYKTWSKTPLKERKERLIKAKDNLEAQIPDLTVLMTREHGKAISDSENELVFAVTICNHILKVIDEVMEDEVIMDSDKGKLIVIKQPMGVVGAISPWNYPIDLCINKIVPAIITGNTVVVKPSPLAPLTVSKVIEIIAKEMPAGVVNLVHGPTEVGEELTSNAKVSKIGFTGGTATAKHIMKAASGNIKNMTLELGGNDPAILLEDADLSEESITRLVIGTFLTSGQICMAAKRIYVHESIYDTFLDKYKKAANNWIKVGDGLDKGVTVGPLNNKDQKELVEELIEDARNQGAEITKLGEIVDDEIFDKGYFLQPTLVTNISQEARLVKEEQFGPTVPVIPFKDEEEGIKLANDSIFGLSSSVWSKDPDNATRVARQLEAGYTFINTHGIPGIDIRAPFGGVKQSGIGREYGKEGLLAYLELHTISYPKSGAVPVTSF